MTSAPGVAGRVVPSRGVRKAALLLFALWFALLWWFSGQSTLPEVGVFPHVDKVQHAAYFMCGAVLLTVAWPPRSWPQALLRVTAVVLVGVSDEWHQMFTPGRSGGDAGDLLADTMGAAAGVALASYALARLRSRAEA